MTTAAVPLGTPEKNILYVSATGHGGTAEQAKLDSDGKIDEQAAAFGAHTIYGYRFNAPRKRRGSSSTVTSAGWAVKN